MTNEECLHETLYFGSGDFYMICRKCQRYWRMEDHYSNNVGEACKLSGQDRVTARPEERAQNVPEVGEGGSGAANWNRSNPAPFGSDPGPSADADCARNTIHAEAWKLVESFAAPVGMDMAACQESWGTEGEAKYHARMLLLKRLRMNSGERNG